MSSGECGAALLMAVILTAALSAATASVLTASGQLALELRARGDVICAHYAALSALALPPSPMSGAVALSRLGGRVDSVEVGFLVDDAGRCRLVSRARCGDARRRASVELSSDAARWCGLS